MQQSYLSLKQTLLRILKAGFRIRVGRKEGGLRGDVGAEGEGESCSSSASTSASVDWPVSESVSCSGIPT